MIRQLKRTLWDLLEAVRPAPPRAIAPPSPPARPAGKPAPVRKKRPARPRPARPAPAAAPVSPDVGESLPDGLTMAERYDAVVELMLRSHGVRVRKWRKSMSGVAWEVRYRDGRVVRLIEAPRPKGPMSAAIFLHEIGHHAIGLDTYKPRCLEEYHAWAWSVGAMRRHGIAVTPSVERRMRESLRYAVRKAKRRGIRSIPPELTPYC